MVVVEAQASCGAGGVVFFVVAGGGAGGEEFLFREGEVGAGVGCCEGFFGGGESGAAVEGSGVVVEVVPDVGGFGELAVDA